MAPSAIVTDTTNGIHKDVDDKVYVAGSASNDSFGENVKISTHPVLMHKISVLRSSSTIPSSFRSVLREITYKLGYEATISLKTSSLQLTVPVGHDHITCTGTKISDRVSLIPIMRSGLGMVDSMLELVPNSGVHHIGMYKTHNMPVQYYNRLPKVCNADVAFVLDPVIESAETMLCVLGILKNWGVAKIHVIVVIASKSGLDKISSMHPNVSITVGQVDSELDEKGVLLPGLGDAGDRLFGTPLIVDDEEELMHTSKRKRTMD